MENDSANNGWKEETAPHSLPPASEAVRNAVVPARNAVGDRVEVVDPVEVGTEVVAEIILHRLLRGSISITR